MATGPAQFSYFLSNSSRSISCRVQPPAPDPVAEHHGQPRRDPVGDDQQEVLVLGARVVQAGEREDEADRAEDQGHDRPAQGQRELDPQSDERHRTGVDVQHVRGDAAQAIASSVTSASGVLISPVKAPVGLLPSAAVRVDHGRGGRADGLQQHAGHEQAEEGPQATAVLLTVGAHVAGVVRGVRVPADRVAERRADREQESAGIPPPVSGAPGCALDSTTTEAIRKMIARTGNAYRSKMCTRLWPKNAIATWRSPR